MALFTVDQFVTQYNNKLIKNGGIECVAVANQFQATVIGGGWIGTQLTGYAKDWWKQYDLNATEKLNYMTIGAGEKAQKGDLAVWSLYPESGKPHIALVLSDLGTQLQCFTQNPKPAHKENLIKTGLLGYLRPKKFAGVILATAAQIDAAYIQILGRHADAGGMSHYKNYTLAFVKNDLMNSAEKRRHDAAKKAPAKKPVVAAAKYVTVAQGFTMWGYEQAHGIAHGRLQQLNPGVVPERIAIGQKIRVA